MTHTARYAVTYLGSGLVRLPRAGVFQTGTRAVVDEQLARIAVAHGDFAVEPLTADAPALGPPPAAAPPPKGGKRAQRTSAAVRVPATSAIDASAADPHTR
jgi:hypothetical protein